ncbi:chymotrypsin-2-like, partial [Calliopsis andreniformis]|uniref:chymotrypsin-2-like n=1 Tax=Calliopsis andreniformis TaxID=337506 RepID=UPI003FCE0CC8
ILYIRSGLDPRIVGGSPAPLGKYPYQVSVKQILNNSYTVCGGSIISKRYVLTAAHCIYKNTPTYYSVVAGTIDLMNNGDVYKAEELIWHADYNPKTIVNDIGLIRVNRDIQFTKYVQPIPIATTIRKLYNKLYFAVSRNKFLKLNKNDTTVKSLKKLSTNSSVSNKLQAINLTIISQSLCKENMPIRETNICTLTKSGEGACKGDSGGPLVVNNTQVGIVSFGYIQCAAGLPDAYTRVYSYGKWIAKKSGIKWHSTNAGSVNRNSWSALLLVMSTIALRLRFF